MADYSVDYRILCGGVETDTATVSGPITPIADAVDDNAGTLTSGTATAYDVSGNDVPCNFGATTTYALVAGSETNCTVTGTGPNFDITPTAPGAFSFDYNILCDGNVADTATVTGTGAPATADAVNDLPGAKQSGTQFTYDTTVNDTACSVGTTTYEIVPGSESNCTATIDPNTGVITIDVA